MMEKTGSVKNDGLWYKDAIIYELHIKAFHDSNGDGIGDFAGLMQKLDYIQDLGVTAIWLLPFYPSPLKDDGYDIADYYAINSSYGTLEDFKKFLEEAHRRNLKVITELVINHTSDQHPWFQRARKAPLNSPERDFYVWTDDPEKYKDVRIIFQDFEPSNWSWDPVAQQYYWHRFFHHQPDLNYDSPLVQEEIFKVLDFWCELGVDGFRLDAVPYLYEREGTNGENLPETHAFLKKLRAHIDSKFPGTVFLAEANMWPEDSASYFGDGDECHMNYHFPVMPRMFMALHREDRYPITDIFDQTPPIPENGQWAMFLRNHDELTLEMVTDEERDYMYKVYAKDPKAKINLGIRHRLAPLMDNDRRKIELMNCLLFSLPGTPVIYYGDEIGMGDNFYLGDRDGVRTPMQWSPDRNAGFSSANPHSLYLPVIMDPEYNYEAVNVELQRGNTSSLFWYMKRMISMRKNFAAFGRGDMKFIDVDNPKVLAFTRTHEDETLLVVVSLSKYSQAVELYLPQFTGYVPVELFSRNRFPAFREDNPYFLTLGAHSFQWFSLQPSKYFHTIGKSLELGELNSLEELFQGSQMQALFQTILPSYLKKMHWFMGRKRDLHTISLLSMDKVELPISDTYLLLISAQYETGLPESYFLPITFAKHPLAKSLQQDCPQSIIAETKIGGEEGVICDALFIPEFQHWLFYKIADSSLFKLQQSSLRFEAMESIKEHAKGGSIKPRIFGDQQNNTAIIYDNRFFLKVYRKVDSDINPDLELNRLLSIDRKFEATPTYLGAIHWELKKETVPLALMQVMIENHGDGWKFMQERVSNYNERVMARGFSEEFYNERGRLTQPLFEEALSPGAQSLLGGQARDWVRMLGERIAQMHISLADSTDHVELKPEAFSLHYQRSLFSGLQTLVRETVQAINRNGNIAPSLVIEALEQIRGEKEHILSQLKRIYERKLEAAKIRIHGNLNLQQVLYTGRDLSIHDFGGNPFRDYSERRLKRSPLLDLASMIRSFYYVSFKTLRSGSGEMGEKEQQYAQAWACYMSRLFLKAYEDKIGNHPVLNTEASERELILETFLVEGALKDLIYEISDRPDYVIIPLTLLSEFELLRNKKSAHTMGG